MIKQSSLLSKSCQDFSRFAWQVPLGMLFTFTLWIFSNSFSCIWFSKESPVRTTFILCSTALEAYIFFFIVSWIFLGLLLLKFSLGLCFQFFSSVLIDVLDDISCFIRNSIMAYFEFSSLSKYEILYFKTCSVNLDMILFVLSNPR